MTSADDDKEAVDRAHPVAPERAEVLQYERDGAWVVVARGTYDMSTAEPLADALHTAAVKHPRVVVDAAGVSFADSTFLNLLLEVHRHTELRLAAPPPQLLRVLELTGADGVIAIHPDVEDALR
jgi:anti-anti-sigma factor